MSDTIQNIYCPLDESKREIRLLEIVLNVEGQPLTCKLHQASLEDGVAFAAMSYVWGDASITKDILVNGQRFAATVSLESALRNARRVVLPWKRSWENLWIWADAICINQKDLSERASQVSTVMRDIYRTAKVVLCSLGPADERIGEGLLIMAQYYLAYRNALEETKAGSRAQKIQRFREIGHRFLPSRVDRYLENSEDTMIESSAEEVFQGLTWMKRHNLFPARTPDGQISAWEKFQLVDHLPYWSRAWIFQELALAKQAIVFCGDYSIHYFNLRLILMVFGQIRNKLPDERPPFLDENFWNYLVIGGGEGRKVGELIDLVQRKMPDEDDDERNETAWDIAMSAGDLAATDPRDYVYGLQGVLQLDIVVDYTLSVLDVYKNLFRCYLRDNPGRLDILMTAGIGYGMHPEDWPSWVPSIPFGVRPRLEHSLFQRASRQADACAQICDDSTISIRGRMLDIVSDLHDDAVQLKEPTGSFCAFVRDFCTRKASSQRQPLLQILRLLFRNTDRLIDAQTLSIMVAAVLFMILGDMQNTHRYSLDLTLVGLTNEHKASDIVWNILWPECETSAEPAARECARVLEQFREFSEEERKSYVGKYWPHITSIEFYIRRQRVIETKEGRLGLAPPLVLSGDWICPVDGYRTLAVLRHNHDHFLFIGDCFVSELMSREEQGLVGSEGIPSTVMLVR